MMLYTIWLISEKTERGEGGGGVALFGRAEGGGGTWHPGGGGSSVGSSPLTDPDGLVIMG